MNKVTLEATESSPEMIVEFVDATDLGIVGNPLAKQICDAVNDQILQHTLRGRARGKKHVVGMVYQVMPVLVAFKSGTRSGEPNEKDKELAVKKYATPEFDFDAWVDGLVKRFPGLTLPTFDGEDEVLDIARVYRAVRLWKPTDI